MLMDEDRQHKNQVDRKQIRDRESNGRKQQTIIQLLVYVGLT
jgi:hypothetical protein